MTGVDCEQLFKKVEENLGVEPVTVVCKRVKRGGRARGNRIWFSCEVVAVHEYVHAIQFSKITPTFFSLFKSLVKSFFRSMFYRRSVNLVKAFQEGFAEYVTADVMGYGENSILARERPKILDAGRIGFATSFFNSYLFGLEYYRIIEKAFGRKYAVQVGLSSPREFKKAAEEARKLLGVQLPDLV
jgi:hypothetical protein